MYLTVPQITILMQNLPTKLANRFQVLLNLLRGLPALLPGLILN